MCELNGKQYIEKKRYKVELEKELSVGNEFIWFFYYMM